MRVVAGKWRGRKLQSPQGDLIRPTTDRVKESIFSMINPSLAGSLVLDLCCGAGGLGIEALSRGAARVVMIDTNRTSIDLARKNLKLCGAENGSYDLIKADAEVFFNSWNPPADETPWLILCDPPYHSGVAAGILNRLVHQEPLPGFQVAVIEHGKPQGFAERDDQTWKINNRRYGDTCLTIVRPG